MDLDLDAYAAAMVALAAAGDARAEVLGRLGLDEDAWARLDGAWQARLSEALDEQGDGAPPLFVAFSAAYEAATRALAPPISIERFALVTRLLSASGDLGASLAKASVTLSEYVRATDHWSRKMAQDPGVERRFDEALRGPR